MYRLTRLHWLGISEITAEIDEIEFFLAESDDLKGAICSAPLAAFRGLSQGPQDHRIMQQNIATARLNLK
ncbi:hypothetical protein [Leptolyngbya iicbica]|uniref:Uncharacterized protein n=1 Tax=Leptolyngbya iicbica LK TaxID=2294035 RepID=A0A4Q7E1L6_9CYAN|nr:hypothetical protein DYY88_22275 [Leptolyngbya sp. LK]